MENNVQARGESRERLSPPGPDGMEHREFDVSHSSIRVDVGLLDKVMNLVGELVLARNQILQFTAGQEDTAFLNASQRLNLVTTELQEGVMKTRMQPVGKVWNKFPRVVRDLAEACGKEVALEMEGASTELDKTVLEAIKDPLTHIIRNSVDHGIELPEQRAAAGKPTTGQVRLRAFHEGGKVNLEIIDDGGGIPLERVKQKAIERGLVTARRISEMSEREALNLIFLPGLSTAGKVSDISGRGVGMDVVKTNIEKIGGTVDIQSVPGQGTTFRIKIPLTLAIIPALIVTSGNDRYAIPQANLLELVRLEGDGSAAIEMVSGAPVYRLRGSLLPLVYLNQELKKRSVDSGQVTNIIVLQADDRSFGLVVDQINDTEEIVVKPLGRRLKGSSNFAGGTIMGDGQVALILDVMGLAQKANLLVEDGAEAARHHDRCQTVLQDNRELWLVFRVNSSEQLALPLARISRLEELEPSTVEVSGQHRVVQYRGQIMPLVPVARTLGLEEEKTSDSSSLPVIVCSQEGRSVGLVVSEILDIVEEEIKVEDGGQRAGLLGSAVIQQRVTNLLDIPGLLAAAQIPVETRV